LPYSTDRKERGVNESEMIQSVQTAVARLGVDDEIRAAGLFEPRGNSGSMFAGGLIGGDIGDDLGAGGVGTVAGALGGQHAGDVIDVLES
jgi:uncharacterized protein YcfJ